MSEPLVTINEVLDRASDMYDDGHLRAWYEDTVAERLAKRNTRRISNGQTVTVDKVYDLTIMQPVYRRKEGEPAERPITLRGWMFAHPAGWNDQYLVFQKRPKGRDWGGVTRELRPDRILEAVEVTA